MAKQKCKEEAMTSNGVGKEQRESHTVCVHTAFKSNNHQIFIHWEEHGNGINEVILNLSISFSTAVSIQHVCIAVSYSPDVSQSSRCWLIHLSFAQRGRYTVWCCDALARIISKCVFSVSTQEASPRHNLEEIVRSSSLLLTSLHHFAFCIDSFWLKMSSNFLFNCLIFLSSSW